MSLQRLEHLLKIVAPITEKKIQTFEKLSPEQLLVITLSFLAPGESKESFNYTCRVERARV